MALSKDSVQKAWYILNEINPNANNSFIAEEDPNDEFRTNLVIGAGKKSDGGWESVFMNVQDISATQLEIFENRKKGVPNSSFKNQETNGITCIGWF